VSVDVCRAVSTLADDLPAYWHRLRDLGFTRCFVREDWIQEHCERNLLELHSSYLKELARECISTGTNPSFLYTDSCTCHSSVLNELKAKRFSLFGSVELLQRSTSTRHFLELCPCEREFMRGRLSSESSDRYEVERQVATFVQRRKTECERFTREADAWIATQSLEVGLSPRDISTTFLEMLGARIAKQGPVTRAVEIAQDDGPEPALIVELKNDRLLAVMPTTILGAHTVRPGSEFGKFFVVFRILAADALEVGLQRLVDSTPLNLHMLAPNGMADYWNFDALGELFVNLSAWSAFTSIVLPDAVRSIEIRS
jgi:hypothetical protein